MDGSLAKGNTSLWTTWSCLNRLRTGVACSTKQLKGWNSLQAVELSQTAVQIVSNLPSRSNGGLIYCFWRKKISPCGPAGWLALILTKAGDVETNPGPSTVFKRYIHEHDIK